MKFHQIDLPKQHLADYCRKRKIRELALFGSVLRDDFRPESDIDVMVTFDPDCGYSLFDLAQIKEELESVFGHQVDLVEKESLRNPFRRHAILNNMEVVYAD
ncbi:MAG: nucleotidyltransferase family protein [Planctomycetia bacterium]|nr:nucleotidyltransferase family protein [Planctomycetia bacterium]